jgi:hypothetical protein
LPSWFLGNRCRNFWSDPDDGSGSREEVGVLAIGTEGFTKAWVGASFHEEEQGERKRRETLDGGKKETLETERGGCDL